ncbi:uncharacterized protein LOC126906873 [Daktulosphaira vitifoliae]|uniref:uncharacterized protein LOC126906873 n=1 Tax=Daktulosphaira vitifoliae TaxID=58002 RepID=UPI0021AABDE5|nr:uncharacterized protein LOC126906873 [Daktulosphaira vitifoliae]XP_050543747.1 uncharacterized protein LOC126906873 [Daktulosphaira vitifoliae]
MIMNKSPVFFISSLLGLFPSYDYHNLSKKVGIVIIVLLLIYYYEDLKYILLKAEYTNYNKIWCILHTTLNISLLLICYINSIVNYNLYSSFTNNISIIDNLSKHLEISFNYNVSNYKSYTNILLIIFLTISFEIFHQLALTEQNFPLVNLVEIACVPMIWLQVFQLDILLKQLAIRFNYVNYILETNIEKMMRTYWIQWCPIGSKEISILNHIHLLTYTSFKEICLFYNMQLLVIIPRVIVSNILPVHYNVVLAFSSKKNSTPWSQIFTLSMIILTIYPIIHLVKCASETISKATQITESIHKLLDQELEQKFEDELYIFSQQLLHRPMKFSVKECFAIKPSLIASMLELIVTYVIILLQFQDSIHLILPAQFLVSPKN